MHVYGCMCVPSSNVINYLPQGPTKPEKHNALEGVSMLVEMHYPRVLR